MMIMKLCSLFLFSLLSLCAVAQRRGNDPRVSAIMAISNPSALQDTLLTLMASNNEADLQLLVNYYNATQNTDKSTEIAALILQRFPDGRAAFNELGERIYNER